MTFTSVKNTGDDSVEEFITIRDAVASLKTTEKQIRWAISTGRIGYVMREGGRQGCNRRLIKHVSRREVEAWLRA